MKKFTLSSLLTLAVFGLMSFTNSPAPDAADVNKWSYSYDVDSYIWNECNSEYVRVTGSVDYRYTQVLANGVYHLQYHIMYKNMKGVGETTGAKYKANLTYNINQKSATCDVKQKLNYNLTLIGQGTTPNMVVKIRQTYTWSCDDGVDVDTEYTTDCK